MIVLMDETKFIKLNHLYGVLKQLDVDILKKFNHPEITDEDYFLYGIQNDVTANALNILVNYLTGNIESLGVDNSCRMILEALTILAMNSKGDITAIQKTIYRYSYTYVDLDNFRLLITEARLQEEQFNVVKADRTQCANYIKEHFRCRDKDISKYKNVFNDPCFYLKKDLTDKIKFAKLIEKYFPKDLDKSQLYEFFSIMVHPRCEIDPEVEAAIMEMRQCFVDKVLDLVTDFLVKNNFLSLPETNSDFNCDFFMNPLLINNVNNIKQMEYTFNLSIIKICKCSDGCDWVTRFFLDKIKYLVLDMLTSLSLGYTEHVIASFVPFLELYSIYYTISTHEDLDEFKYLKKGYWILSRLQINEHLKKYHLITNDYDCKDELQALYDAYYASRYKVNSFDEFYDKCQHDGLYFLDHSGKSFNQFVNETLKGVTLDESQSKEFYVLYKIARDMAHASGYNFNATADLIRVTSHKVIYATFYLILQLLLNISATFEEHNKIVDLSNIIEFFKQQLQIQVEAINEIFKNYAS